jgi:hypothetical protein
VFVKIILLAVATSALTMAGSIVRPKACEPAKTVSPAALVPAARKPAKRRSPLFLLKKLEQAEVNGAMRLSSWGIKEPETKRIATPRACEADAQVK